MSYIFNQIIETSERVIYDHRPTEALCSIWSCSLAWLVYFFPGGGVDCMYLGSYHSFKEDVIVMKQLDIGIELKSIYELRFVDES